jgi:dTMP kinase
MTGKLIVIEGIDYAGKTTQARLLKNYLKNRGYKVVLFREPGGTAVGEKIRKILLKDKRLKMDVATELLLYMASRVQLIKEKVTPSIKDGKIVICDRFVFSSAAYQGNAGGFGLKNVLKLYRLVVKNLVPDLTVILDMDILTAGKRAKHSRDRIESRSYYYHKRVRKGFLMVARMLGKKARIVDASKPVKQVFLEIKRAVENVI